MYKQAKPLFLIVETPLHAGSGSDLGIVDLPIQRERHTDFPKIEASGLKGSLREIYESLKENIPPAITTKFPNLNKTNFIDEGIWPTFGPEDGDKFAGSLGFTDARLLLFPVKSMKGVFAWITCPTILERFRNDLSLTQKTIPAELNNFEEFVAKIPIESNLLVKENEIVLEEYKFDVTPNENLTALCQLLSDNILPKGVEYDFWRNKMKKDVAVLPDDDFKDFVNLSTEVIARTKIGESGTVIKGGLWYEEYLPSDSILYSLVLTSPIFSQDTGAFPNGNAETVMEFFELGLQPVVQIGGNATLGKGLMRTKIWELTTNGGQTNDES